MAKTAGTWEFKSEKDSRWNSKGTYAARVGMDHPREAMEQFVALEELYGDPPDDLTQIYTSLGEAR